MTEKQTQPSAIAQAAASQCAELMLKLTDKTIEECGLVTVNLEARKRTEEIVSGLFAALIDKHIAPLTQQVVRDERERQIGYLSRGCWTAGEIASALKWGVDESEHAEIEQQIAESKWSISPKGVINLEATVRSQAEEIERLTKLMDRAHTEFVYISEAPTFELCKSTEMYELIDLLKPQP